MSQLNWNNQVVPNLANNSNDCNAYLSDIKLLKLYQERFGGTFLPLTEPNSSNFWESIPVIYNQGYTLGTGRGGDLLDNPDDNGKFPGGNGWGGGFPGGHGGPGGPFLGHNQNENRGFLLVLQ